MKPLQILMPMGGLGQRFRDAGINTPKPLIDIEGSAMFQKALDTYNYYEGGKRYIFVIRKDTDDEYQLSQKIIRLIPNAKIAILDHNTNGAVETCLIAKDLIDPNLPLVIMDCDISFESRAYFDLIHDAINKNSYDGLLLSFQATEPRYSYAEVDENDLVIRTAEKDPISKNALMGAYFFTKARTFLDAANELISRSLSDKMKEYYVSLIFNILIENKKRISLAHGTFYSFGTPEELNQYLKTHQGRS